MGSGYRLPAGEQFDRFVFCGPAVAGPLLEKDVMTSDSSLSRLMRIHRQVMRVSEWMCGALGAVILAISLMQIGLRVGFSIALPWVFELTSLFTVYAVFFGAVVLILGDRTAQVEMVTRYFPAGIQRAVRYLMALAGLAMGISVIYGTMVYRGILSTYTMSNLPLSASLFSYPILLFGLSLVWRAVIFFGEKGGKGR